MRDERANEPATMVARKGNPKKANGCRRIVSVNADGFRGLRPKDMAQVGEEEKSSRQKPRKWAEK